MAQVPGHYEGEPEIDAARRAFPTAQQLLASTPHRRVPGTLTTGWHDTLTDPETGAFAVVREGAGLDDLFGETLLVTAPAARRSVFVYVLGARDVPVQLSLTRRAFLSLGLLTLESMECVVEVTA